MGINFAGMAAGFQGYQEENRRIADDERKKRADDRAQQDQAFQDEARTRQRKEWTKADEREASTKKFLADDATNEQKQFEDAWADSNPESGITGQLKPSISKNISEKNLPVRMNFAPESLPDQATESAQNPPADGVTQPRPATMAKNLLAVSTTDGEDAAASQTLGASPALIKQKFESGGLPKPQNFNDMLNRQIRLLDFQAGRGDIDPATYATQRTNLNKYRNEGVNDAIDLMAQGQGEEALKTFNSVGSYRDAKFISQRQGSTTLPNGQSVPTNIVTLARPDGSRVEIDSTMAQYQLMKLGDKMSHLDKAAQTKMMSDHYAGTLEVAKQQAATQEKYRQDQGEYLRGRNQATLDAAAIRSSGKQSGLDAKALAAEVKTNAQLYEFTPLNGEKPIEHVAAKSLYSNMIKNPRIGTENAYSIMAKIKEEAEKRSVDEKTGAVDPNKFLPIFNSMVKEADQKMREQPKAQAAPTSSSPVQAGANVRAAPPPVKAPVQELPLPIIEKMTEPLSEESVKSYETALDKRVSDFKNDPNNQDSNMAAIKGLRDLLDKNAVLRAQKDQKDKAAENERRLAKEKRSQALIDNGFGIYADKATRDFNKIKDNKFNIRGGM